MKLDFIWGVLPVILIERERVKGDKNTHNYFLCVSFVEDINDSIQIAHEKAIVKFNYIATILTVSILSLALFINFYVFLITAFIYLPAIVILYWTDVGEYHRDVRAYAASAKEFSVKHGVAESVAIGHYVNIIMESNKYGNFVKKIGMKRVVNDLNKYIKVV